MPGARLFQYRDAEGKRRIVSAAEANTFLKEIAEEAVTAKDFRTLAATATAATLLGREPPAESERGRKRQIAGVMKEVAALLGNTPAVARKSYVHRRVVEAFQEGKLARILRRNHAKDLSQGEAAVAALFAGG